MKKLLIAFVLLTLFSCEKTAYVIEIEKCNGSKDTVSYESIVSPTIDTYKQAVPIMYIGNKKVLNVCDFRILSSKKIIDKD